MYNLKSKIISGNAVMCDITFKNKINYQPTNLKIINFIMNKNKWTEKDIVKIQQYTHII